MKDRSARAGSSGSLSMEDAGQKLKKARERLGLRYRDVEEASARIATRHKNDEFTVALSRLADIENKGTIPSMYRIYALCAIYRLEFTEVLGWYGIDVGSIGIDARSVTVAKTHLIKFDAGEGGDLQAPTALEPNIDLRKTVFLSRIIQKWGKLPFALLRGIDLKAHRYGLIGTDDWTMYPVLHPGSLVLINEAQRKIAGDGWTSDHDRPIYFLEHRNGYYCGWCALNGEQVIMQPHPASHVKAEIFDQSEIDVIGQVDGVAMRFIPPRKQRKRF